MNGNLDYENVHGDGNHDNILQSPTEYLIMAEITTISYNGGNLDNWNLTLSFDNWNLNK